MEKKFVYVSGPSCAGKSTLCNELVQVKPLFHIRGDDFWNELDSFDFDNRVMKTNEKILSFVREIDCDQVILEWVPCNGSYVEELKLICQESGYTFVHIVLYGPIEYLKKRKQKRDGDTNLGPVNIDKYYELKDVLLFNTQELDFNDVISTCKENI